MRILFAASEVYPLAKTGGLADVAGALPLALSKRGHDVTVMMPCYQDLRGQGVKVGSLNLGSGHSVELRLVQLAQQVETLLVDSPRHFDRETIYGHPDDGGRFLVFSSAIANLALKEGFEVVHLNDWHTGPTAQMLQDGGFNGKVIFTIHNLQYQGRMDSKDLGAESVLWTNQNLAQDRGGKINFLLSGVKAAHRLTTVSPTYAREIQCKEYGEGLDEHLRTRSRYLHGVLNGLDTTVWDPSTDPHLNDQYKITEMQGKQECKRELEQIFGWSTAPEIPILAWVGRLSPQKGTSLLVDLAQWLSSNPVRLVVLGSGASSEESRLKSSYVGHSNVRLHLGFDEALAHQIYAGSDILLMPSRFEPCGLSQLIAMRYGTLPLVRSTGGLADTVIDGETGFRFKAPTSLALKRAIRRVLKVWQADRWRKMQMKAMSRDSSWSASVSEYEKLYQR